MVKGAGNQEGFLLFFTQILHEFDREKSKGFAIMGVK